MLSPSPTLTAPPAILEWETTGPPPSIVSATEESAPTLTARPAIVQAVENTPVDAQPHALGH